jgi:hypothetical protein
MWSIRENPNTVNIFQSLKPKDADKNSKKKEYEKVIQIYLETFSKGFKETSLFVSKIAESKSRQEFIQRFEINAGSLYAAVTLGLDHRNILDGLHKHCKLVWSDPKAEKWIKKTADSYGKCRLVLDNNRYYIESPFQQVVEYYFKLEYLKRLFIGTVFQVGGSDSVNTKIEYKTIEEEEHDEFESDEDDEDLLKNKIVEETKKSEDFLSLTSKIITLI